MNDRSKNSHSYQKLMLKCNLNRDIYIYISWANTLFRVNVTVVQGINWQLLVSGLKKSSKYEGPTPIKVFKITSIL